MTGKEQNFGNKEITGQQRLFIYREGERKQPVAQMTKPIKNACYHRINPQAQVQQVNSHLLPRETSSFTAPFSFCPHSSHPCIDEQQFWEMVCFGTIKWMVFYHIFFLLLNLCFNFVYICCICIISPLLSPTPPMSPSFQMYVFSLLFYYIHE